MTNAGVGCQKIPVGPIIAGTVMQRNREAQRPGRKNLRVLK